MPWIAAIGTLYINFLSQMHMMPEMNSSECSAQEGLLLSWAKTMLAWLSGHADPSPTDGDLQKIFKGAVHNILLSHLCINTVSTECQAQLASYTLSALPWTMLHTAQTALEVCVWNIYLSILLKQCSLQRPTLFSMLRIKVCQQRRVRSLSRK